MKASKHHIAIARFFTKLTSPLPAVFEKSFSAPGVSPEAIEQHALNIFGALLGGTIAQLQADGCEQFELIPPTSIQKIAAKHGVNLAQIQNNLWQAAKQTH